MKAGDAGTWRGKCVESTADVLLGLSQNRLELGVEREAGESGIVLYG